MWTHLFTLLLLAKELDRKLEKARIAEIFTYEKNKLCITTVLPSGDDQTLVISVDPQLNYMFLRDPVPRPRRNAVDIFPRVVGSYIVKIFLAGNDRIVVVQTDADLSIGIQLFGTAESNVFLYNNANLILTAFKKSKLFEGKPLVASSQLSEVLSIPDFFSFTSNMQSLEKDTIYSALKSAVPFLGSTYAREILHRTSIDEKSDLHRLSNADLQHIYDAACDLLASVQRPQPTVYLRNNTPRVFSVVPLQHLSGASAETYASVNDAVRNAVHRSLRSQGIETIKQSLIRKFKVEYDRARRALTATKEELREDRATQYERTANIILANLQHLTKGTKVADLENIFSDKHESIRIAMDPKLMPTENTEAYFAKAKRARAAFVESQRRQHGLENRISLLEKFLLHIDQCQTREQIDEFLRENAALLRQLKIVAGSKQEERIPFREFIVNNFTVWVGKGSENNDLLTMKYAKPNDLWFHVRGAAGSHVVLRTGGTKTQPSKETIVKTAQIAAYYSKMRNVSTAPVAYCERKFVRKPRGAQPGTVVVDREKVLFVVPGLP